MKSWIDSVIHSATKDTLLNWILKPNAVRFANSERLSPEEQFTMILSVQSNRKNVDLLIWSPFTSSNLAIVSTAGILLADFLRRERGGVLVRGDVLLVTRQVGRGVSDLTDVRLSTVNLKQVWQVHNAAQLRDRHVRERPNVIVVAPQPAKIADLNRTVDSVVIDATHPLSLERLEDILAVPIVEAARRKVVVLPVGYQPEIAGSEWASWMWDFEAVNQCRQTLRGSPSDWTNQWSRHFLVCRDDITDNLLCSARKELLRLSRSAGKTPSIPLQSAWGVLNRLSSLVVPLGIFEDTAQRHFQARTIRERLDYLCSESPSALQDTRSGQDSAWQSLYSGLQDAYQNLRGDYPAKFWAVARVVEERIQLGFRKPLLLVCPTQLEGNILIRELGKLIDEVSMHLHPDRLIVANPRYLAELESRWNYEVVTAGRFASRWRYLNAAVQEVMSIVYPYEVPVERADLCWAVRRIQENASQHARMNVLSKLGLFDAPVQPGEVAPQRSPAYFSVSYMEGIPERETYAEEHPVSIEQLITPAWEWDADDLTYLPPLRESSQNASAIFRSGSVGFSDGPAVLLKLSDGSIWVVPGGYIFDVFREVTEELEEVPATDLQTNDVLILVDDEGYGHLFDRIIEALEQHPKYSLMRVWLNLWEFTKDTALEICELDFSTLHSELLARGITISEQAVRSWYQGVLAPRDETAIFAIIDLASFPSALKHKRQIRTAIGHVRGMRRATGRRIRQLVKQTAVGQETSATLTDAMDIAVEDVLSASTRVVVDHIQIIYK